ncbi:MAG: MFS transporter [Inquilinaceae bacterium]
MRAPANLEPIFATLGQHNYGVYMAGNAGSLVGLWMQRIAVGWLTWELTGSGAWLGLMAFADLCPSILIGPIGGAVADRISRLRIIAVSQTISMVIAFILFGLIAAGLITVEILFALVLVNGIVIGFNQPSRLAIVPALVSPDRLATAIAINSIVFNLARFIGPAIAGAMIVGVGTAAAFLVNGISYLGLLWALTRIRLPPDLSGPTLHRSLFGDVADGVAYTARHPGIGPMLLLMTAMSICVRPLLELLPGFAADVFGGGAEALAMLSAVVGGGAILGGVWLAQRRGTDGLTRISLVYSGLVIAAAFLFVATDIFWIGLVAASLSGMGMVVAGTGVQTMIQVAVEGTMRARVMSLYGIIFRGGPAAGALVMGTLSEGIGLRWPVAGGAVLALGVLAWAWGRRAAMSHALERARDIVAPPAKPQPDSVQRS